MASIFEKRLENKPSWQIRKPDVFINDNVDRQELWEMGCLFVVCLNGGTCDDSSGYPECKCKAPYYGNACENTDQAPTLEASMSCKTENDRY